jgi:hypothetical protein
MKKVILFLTSLSLCLLLFSRADADETTRDIINISPGSTNVVASSTNSTAGGIIYLPENGIAKTLFIQCGVSGTAASTNGVSASSNVVFRFVVSVDGTNFTSSSTTPYKVTVPAPAGTSIVYGGDWFYLPGIRALKHSATENNTLGSLSNSNARGGFHY